MFDYLNITWRTFTQIGHEIALRLPYVLIGLVVFLAFYVFARLVRYVTTQLGARTRLDAMLADLLGRIAFGITIIIGILAAAVVIFPTFRPGDLIAGLGLTSVAIGFAFKDILQNFFAGILLLWRRPFRVGDQIRSLNYEGTVEDISVRSTRLKTYDGERAILPNTDVYSNAVLVRTAYPIRRVRFSVGIGYSDSIERAREVILRTLSQTEGVVEDPGPWVYVSELAPSSVNFTVYFWVTSEQASALAASNRVATGIKLALDEAGIDMPYPHEVVRIEENSISTTQSRATIRGAGSNR